MNRFLAPCLDPVCCAALIVAAVALAAAGARAAEAPAGAAASFAEVNDQQQKAIARGLAFLARTQNKDGSWTANPSGGRSYPVAMTSLAGLALLAGGHLPGRGKYGEAVRRAVGYLLRRQDPSGLIAEGSGSGGRPMYGHGFATLFLSQVYGMVSDPGQHERLGTLLRRAVGLTARCQSGQGGWYYQPNMSADEGSVTITQVQGLRAARNVGIPVPSQTIRKAVEYIHRSQNDDGSVNYSVGRHHGRGSPALTAAGLEVLYSAGEYSSKQAAKALRYLCRILDSASGGRTQGHRAYFRFYACQAVFQAGDETYHKYWPKLRAQILSEQNADGSWRGDYIGAVYGTALYTIVLQIPYQYLPIYQR